MKQLTVILLLGFSLLAFPSQAQHKLNEHKEHSSAIGIHGMAIFEHDHVLYASHMPLANSIHAHQVLFSFSVNDQSLKELNTLSQQFSLLSLKPERFDLVKLMNGTLTQFNADVYSNHFERNGILTMKNVSITVNKMMLIKPLLDVNGGDYYLVPTSDKKGLLVHRIGQTPSFDQILSVKATKERATLFETFTLINMTKGEPIVLPISPRNGVTVTKQLYLETQDFQ